MRNRAEERSDDAKRSVAEQIDGIGRKSDFKYKGLGMDAPPSRISGVVSLKALTGKEVLCTTLTTRGEVIPYLGARVEASGELQASVKSTSAWKLRFTDFALNLTHFINDTEAEKK